MDQLAAVLGDDFATDLLLKVTVLWCIGALIALLLAKSSAATRHFSWSLCIAGMIALPILVAALPAWRVSFSRPSLLSQIESVITAPRLPDAINSQSPGTRSPRPNATLDSDASARTTLAPEIPSGSMSAALSRLPRAGAVLSLIWLSGTLLILLRLETGWLIVRRQAWKAKPVDAAAWQSSLKDASWLIGIDRKVAMLSSPWVGMPMTFGTLRPVILLPPAAAFWDADRRRVVLLHELAHVARRDHLAQTLADFACAIFWFHPLVWVTARCMRIERERACDDIVLGVGETPIEYAGHLLDVARSYSARFSLGTAAIMMARPSQLEGRLLAVLDTRKRRGAPRRRMRRVGALAGLAILLPLAAVTSEASGNSLATAGIPPDPGMSEASYLVTGAATASDPQASATPDRRVEWGVSAASGEHIQLFLQTGGSIEVVGWDNDSVAVTALLRGPDEAITDVEFTRRDSETRISSVYRNGPQSGNADHRFHVMVPRRSEVHLVSSSGSVSLQGVDGNFSGATGRGDIRLRDLSGFISLATEFGDVTVTDSRLDGRVTTGAGNIRIASNSGDLSGVTGRGTRTIDGAVLAAGAANSPAATSDRSRGAERSSSVHSSREATLRQERLDSVIENAVTTVLNETGDSLSSSSLWSEVARIAMSATAEALREAAIALGEAAVEIEAVEGIEVEEVEVKESRAQSDTERRNSSRTIR